MPKRPVYEHELAAQLGVTKEVIRDIRSRELSADEWAVEQGKGIALSESAEKKIRAALGVPEGAAAVDLTIVRLFPNPRRVEAAADGGEVLQVFLVDRQPVPPRRGWMLRGCVWSEARGMYEFNGRAARA